MIGIQTGYRADTVIGYLAEAHRTAMNRLGGGQPGDLHEYLTWAATHIRTLGPSIKPLDLNSLITTPTYWSLLSLAGRERFGAGVHHIVEVEISQRAAALDNARNELDIDFLQSRGADAAVLDTNVLMVLGEQLETYEWHKHLGIGLQEPLLVWIPLAVIDELDRLKRDRNTMNLKGVKVPRRTLARNALREIDRMFPEPNEWHLVKQGEEPRIRRFQIQILMEEPGHTRLPSVDAEVVDQAVNLAAMGGRVQVVTFDTGMRLKARASEVLARQLPEPEDD